MGQNEPEELAPRARRDSTQLEQLLEIALTLVSSRDLEGTLSKLLEVARELTGARYAAVGVLDGDRRQLERFITSGIDRPGREAIGDLPRGRGVLGLLIDRPELLRLADIGDHPASYGFPDAHPPMTTFLGVPIVIRGEVWGNLYLTEKVGGPFDAEDEAAVRALAGWAAVAIDNARLHEAAERNRSDLAHAVRSLEATVAIARAVGGETQLDRVLELIVERGRALINAREMVVLLVVGDELVLAAHAGEAGGSCVGQRVALAGSAFERSLRVGTLEQVADPFRDADPELTGLRAANALLVPLRYRGLSVGVLAALPAPPESGRFGTEQAELMDSVAVSAAIAVRTARSVEDERARRALQAAEAERSRWARELHDGTLQGLGGLQISLAAARRTADPAVRDRVLGQAAEQATEEIAQLRELITDLRPVALDELGVAAALEVLADRTQRDSGLRIGITTQFDFEAGRASSRHVPELETAIYRIVQQALSNAVQHAGARRVDVSVRDVDDQVVVIVEDDGRGFDVHAQRTGFGLIGMQERVELEHGTLRVVSEPRKGTRAEATLSVRRRSA